MANAEAPAVVAALAAAVRPRNAAAPGRVPAAAALVRVPAAARAAVPASTRVELGLAAVRADTAVARPVAAAVRPVAVAAVVVAPWPWTPRLPWVASRAHGAPVPSPSPALGLGLTTRKPGGPSPALGPDLALAARPAVVAPSRPAPSAR